MRSLTMLALLGLASPAWAVPAQFVQQGRLAGPDGTGLESSHDLTFRLYGESSGGAPVWEEAHATTFTAGVYTATLGESVALDSGLLLAYPLWLELEVDGTVLSPRQPVTSAPYAGVAGVAERLEGGAVDATGVSVGGSEVIASDGRWVGPTPDVGWMDLSGVPADLADGDADTLTGISCSDREALVYDAVAGAWGCGVAGEGVLTESEVRRIVTSAAIDLAAGSTIGGRTPRFTDEPDADTLGGLSCLDGEIARWDAVALEWTCGADAGLDAAAVGALVDARGYASASDLTTLSADVAAMGTTLDTLATDVASGSADLADLTLTCDTLTGEVADLGGRVTVLESGALSVSASLASLAARVTSVEGGVSGLTSRVGALETDATTLDGRFTTLEVSASSIASAVASLSGTVSSILSTLTSISTTITTITTNISSLSSTASELGTSVDSHEARLVDLEGASSTTLVWMDAKIVTHADNTDAGICGLTSGGAVRCSYGYGVELPTSGVAEVDACRYSEGLFCWRTTSGEIGCVGADHAPVLYLTGTYTAMSFEGSNEGLVTLNTSGALQRWVFDPDVPEARLSWSSPGPYSQIQGNNRGVCALSTVGEIDCLDSSGGITRPVSGTFTSFASDTGGSLVTAHRIDGAMVIVDIWARSVGPLVLSSSYRDAVGCRNGYAHILDNAGNMYRYDAAAGAMSTAIRGGVERLGSCGSPSRYAMVYVLTTGEIESTGDLAGKIPS